MRDAKRKLAEILITRSFLENHEKPFLLASGKTSPFYFECSLTTTWPPALPLIGKLIFDIVAGRVRAIGGPTMGADPIAAAVAYYSAATATPLPWFSIRKAKKDHGVGGQLEGSAPASGEPVAIVDDESVFAFDGRHLGWFLDGWIRDHAGDCVYFTDDASGGARRPHRRPRPARGARRPRPRRLARQARPARSARTTRWSELSVGPAFFRQ